MKLSLFLIFLAALIQTVLFPVNLCLIFLIARTLVTPDKSNLILGFVGGLMLGVLSSTNLGFWPIVFLLIITVFRIMRKLPYFSNMFITGTSSVLLIILSSYIRSLVFRTGLDPKIIFFEVVLLGPVFLATRFWEERFVVKPELKLKIRQ